MALEPTTEEMNALQGETNLISDNAVSWADVAECDRVRAQEWLWRRRASKADLPRRHRGTEKGTE